MAQVKGDATQDEIDEQLKVELAGKIAASSDSNPVRLSTAEATRVLELLGGAPEQKPVEEEEKSAKERAREAGVAPVPAAGTPEGQAVAGEEGVAATGAKSAEEEDDDDDEPGRARGGRRRK